LSRNSRLPWFVAACGLVAAAAIVAGCGIFSNPPAPTTTGPSGTGPATPNLSPGASTQTTNAPTAAPTNPVKSIVLISAIGESGDGTPSELAWRGVQDAASLLGVRPERVIPVSMAGVTAAVNQAADNGSTIVMTVGPDAVQAVLDNADNHPATQFFELDQTIADGAPANVHGLVFDETEAGYLAGFVAASVTASDRIGMVGFTKTDVRTANYANGFRSGAMDANPKVKVTVAYATRTDNPQKGRAATDGLVKAKADVILAMSDLTGAGVMREACARNASVVALDTDASLVLPDVDPCLVVSVLERYDVATHDAILAYAAKEPISAVTVFDVANGGIGLSDFHEAVTPDLQDRLAGVVAAMRSGPPRPTPTPAPTLTASPVASQKP
jgi:basic membrane protein A